jgi:hypothetical protein
LKHWSSSFRLLVLTGNAGTGKSWFQAYALRRLAQEDSTYKFVVRQVAKTYFLHDLRTHNVYKIEYKDEYSLETLVNGMTETLYFFEPGPDNKRSPTSFTIPSLSTLSPNEDRIKEYSKQNTVIELFFPVWSESEYWAVGLNEKRAKEDIKDRYNKYGGILRHLFRNKVGLEMGLYRCLTTDKLAQFLRAEVTDVDTDERNGNASGYLVCYAEIPFDGVGAFKSRKLRLTSSYARQKIRENMDLVTEVESAKKVLKVLSGARMFDFGGNFLESTFTTMIAGGPRKTKWEACKVGTAEWNGHTRNKMTVECIAAIEREGVDNMANSLSKDAGVLVPSNPNFPVVDIVESQPNEKEAVTAYQITWQDKHPFRMEALCQLREKELKIARSRLLKIFFVVPGNEETYAKRQKTDYLKKDKKNEASQSKGWSADETEMWKNTPIYVLRPKEGWKSAIETFFFTK